MLSSQYVQQQAYAQQQAAMAMNTLLPTPPSSPPRVGLHPVESTITLLENLVAFYHQERMWVYRTRAQLEMSGDDGDATTAGGATQDEEEETGEEEPDLLDEEMLGTSKWMKRKKAFGLKLEGIATTRGISTAARGGVAKQRARPLSVPCAQDNQTDQPAAGGRDPGVEILEMFERMMQARMESCERVTRMVRNATGSGSPQTQPDPSVYAQSSFFFGVQ